MATESELATVRDRLLGLVSDDRIGDVALARELRPDRW
jgi:hypothetical protein